MQPKKNSTRMLTATAMLAAMSTVLMLLDFPIPIFPSFLQFDFSDLPAIIAAFAYGPICGLAVELIKNLIHLFWSSTQYVGELANFLVGAALVVPAGIIYSRHKTRGSAVTGMVSGVVVMTVLAAFVNTFVLIPFYSNFMHLPMEVIIGMITSIIPTADTLMELVLFGIVPFNIFKGIIICAISYFVYKRISPVLHGRR